MAAEIEAKFCDIDHDRLRQQLSACGFTCTQPETLMRRVVFETPHSGPHSWARVRDEGSRVTVTFKRTHDLSRADGTEEIEIVADDFDAACALLDAFGLIRKSYQETRREIWWRGAVEAALDEWPAIPPFIEIEAPDETQVRAAAAALGFDWDKAVFGPVGSVYAQHGISHQAINAVPRLTFGNIGEIQALAR